MDDLEQRIRDHAFYLWEQAGCPEGRAEEFWALAAQVESAKTPESEPAGGTSDPDEVAGF